MTDFAAVRGLGRGEVHAAAAAVHCGGIGFGGCRARELADGLEEVGRDGAFGVVADEERRGNQREVSMGMECCHVPGPRRA